MNNRVLLVDDNRVFANSFSEYLQAKDLLVDCCYTYQEAVELLKKREYDVCVFDILLPDGSGLQLTETIMNMDSTSEVILITASDTQYDSMNNLLKDFIFDYLQKPFDMNHAVKRIQNAAEHRSLKMSKRFDSDRQARDSRIVGTSTAIRTIRDLTRQLANVRSPVLITGETGTGKELVARAVHFQGERRNYPFVPVNCSAIPQELFEAEFFGHEQGAFTGAAASRKGLFEIATKGTLFLDEIGEMDKNFQSKLLRVLELGEYRRVGGQKTLHTRARLIAATNRNLAKEVEAKRFREDLFYRISVIQIEIPPLRKRIEDIPLVAHYLWEKLTAQLNRKLAKPTEEWFINLSRQSWPGNVRELSNFIERGIILGTYPEPDTVHQSSVPVPGDIHETAIEPLADVVRQHIKRAYESCNRNKTRTARVLDISLSTLKRKLAEMQID